MNRSCLIVFLVLISPWLHAQFSGRPVFRSPGVPANHRQVTECRQPDGSVVNIRIFGDAAVNWAETEDGYTLLQEENEWMFAHTLADGALVASGFIAANSENRDPATRLFLSDQSTHQRFSEHQIKYKIGACQLLRNRQALKTTKDFPATGKRKLLMILANFSNTSTTFTQGDFTSMMNQAGYNGKGSFRDYYLENSYGLLDITTTVTVWVKLPHPREYYGPDENWGEFAYDAIKAADPFVNYASFDNDGDGNVDGIAIVHQGRGEEESGDEDDIWSHSWDLVSAGYTATQRRFDGVRITEYTTHPEKRNSTAISEIGVICHEFGHALGAPDFYDTDYDLDGEQEGTGYWDVMDGGSYNGSPMGSQPAHHNPWTKDLFGWLSLVELKQPTIVSLRHAAKHPEAYQVMTQTANEYFILENRQQVGFDAALPGHGLLIYHADGNYINSHLAANEVNASSHEGLYLKAANGNRNTASCPYPGTANKTAFTDTSTPNAINWAGKNTDKPITDIQENDGIISLNFNGGDKGVPGDIKVAGLSPHQIQVTWTPNPLQDPVLLAWSANGVFGQPDDGKIYQPGALITGGGQILYYGTDTEILHDSLAVNTRYYYQVWSYVSGSYSQGLVASSLTQCGLMNLPFYEGFEHGVPPVCWQSFMGVNGLGSENNWERDLIDPYKGSGCAHIGYESVTGGRSEDWLVLPQITMDDEAILSYYEKQYYTADYGSVYSIRISTGSGTDPEAFQTIKEYGELSFSKQYTQRKIDLSAFSGQDVYVAFVLTQNDGDEWYLDEVSIGNKSIGIAEPSVKPVNKVLYPNPTTGVLQWSSNHLKHLAVYDLLGSLLIEQGVYNLDKTIDLSTLPDGLYLVKMACHSGVRTEKISLERP